MKRRALSTVVGAVFFVIVMASSIAYVGYSMNTINNLAESVTTKQDQNINRQNEEFMITDVSVDNNNKFNFTVKNTGSIPINITKMWAQNMTDSTWNQTKYQLNQLVSPGKSVSGIGTGTGLVVLNSSSYNVKLVTERGNSLNTQILSPSDEALEMTLFTSPANPLNNNDVSLLFSVKNNLTAGSLIQSLVPEIDVTGTGVANMIGTVQPQSVEGLRPGETAFFEWTYDVSGSPNDGVSFNATVANAVQGNYVEDDIVIGEVEVSETAITAALADTFGTLAMNFTSFQACIPSGASPDQDCESDSNDWTRAWEVDPAEGYLWRLNVTNTGTTNIIIDEASTLLFIPIEVGGSVATSVPYFIRADCTTTDEDGAAYNNNSPKILNATETEMFYFGSEKAGESNILNSHGSEAIVAVALLVFGYEDINDSGDVDGPDLPYSQNLPFQAFKVLSPT